MQRLVCCGVSVYGWYRPIRLMKYRQSLLWRGPFTWDIFLNGKLWRFLPWFGFSVCYRVNPQVDDTRIWIGDWSRANIFKRKSTYRLPPFLVSNFIWKAKAPLKIRGFVWTSTWGRINTNDMIRRRHLTMALSLDICVMCRRRNEISTHLFLHCEIAQ